MINISERASGELQKLIGSMPEPRPRVRVFIDHRCHCGKTHFSMSLEASARAGDQEFLAEGVPFVADAEAAAELPSVEIDYSDTWMQRGFTIRNMNHNCASHQAAG
jgi:iron-sulfur cluster assembly accessory protein